MLKKNYEWIQKVYGNQHIKKELMITIGAITGSKRLIRQTLEQKGADMKLCSALQELENENIDKGRYLSLRKSIENLIKNQIACSEEEACNMIGQNYGEYLVLKEKCDNSADTCTFI